MSIGASRSQICIVDVLSRAPGVAGQATFVEDLDYFGRAVMRQYRSAVTCAGLLVRRKAHFAVGGLDEAGLTVAFNDIDIFLKLREAGHDIIYDHYAVLMQHG